MCYVKTKADQRCRNLLRPVYLENCQQLLLTIAVYIKRKRLPIHCGKMLKPTHLQKHVTKKQGFRPHYSLF